MAASKYKVLLTEEDRETLREIVSYGVHKAREIRRARTLLLLDKDLAQSRIAFLLDISPITVLNTTKAFFNEGLEGALFDKHRSGQPIRIGKKEEALITAIACQVPPEGRSRWTIEMIRNEFLILSEDTGEVSLERVRQTLKKIV